MNRISVILTIHILSALVIETVNEHLIRVMSIINEFLYAKDHEESFITSFFTIIQRDKLDFECVLHHRTNSLD